jgi:hypothetical protein
MVMPVASRAASSSTTTSAEKTLKQVWLGDKGTCSIWAKAYKKSGCDNDES